MSAEPIADYVFSSHALGEMARRELDLDWVRRVLAAPEQRWPLRSGRDMLQSRRALGHPPKTFLLRVVVDTDRRPCEVVTAYRTSKLDKYWRKR